MIWNIDTHWFSERQIKKTTKQQQQTLRMQKKKIHYFITDFFKEMLMNDIKNGKRRFLMM